LCGNQLASLVDHIVPLRAGGARLDPENFQGLDVQCQVVKTRRDMERWPEYRR
jgi:5-methylcytosine-specific restriction endonuclease McrA